MRSITSFKTLLIKAQLIKINMSSHSKRDIG